jgi:hypothetical protein
VVERSVSQSVSQSNYFSRILVNYLILSPFIPLHLLLLSLVLFSFL